MVAASRCALCNTTLGIARRDLPFLCTSLVCAHRYSALTAQQKCRQCARPLRVAELARGVCNALTCRRELEVQRIVNTKRAVESARLASATARRNRDAARRGMSQEERNSFRVVVLPRNDAQPTSLDAERRARLSEHLLASIGDARARKATGHRADPRDDIDESLTRGDAAKALVVAGCTACRGNCCTNGGESAYITGTTMLSYLERWPDHDDATIVARYLSHLSAETLEGGCIFQSAVGCTIPRELRSVTCNTFFCDSIIRLRSGSDAPDATRAYFTQLVGRRLVGGNFVDRSSRESH